MPGGKEKFWSCVVKLEIAGAANCGTRDEAAGTPAVDRFCPEAVFENSRTTPSAS